MSKFYLVRQNRYMYIELMAHEVMILSLHRRTDIGCICRLLKKDFFFQVLYKSSVVVHIGIALTGKFL